MQSMCQLLLVVAGALGALGLRGPLLKRSDSDGRLELDLYQGDVIHRIRRQAYFDSNPCLTITFLSDLKDRFAQRIDPDDDGKATFDEIRKYLQNFNPGVTQVQVANFIRRRDLNGNGVVDLIPEYIADIATPDTTAEAAAEWFSLEDANGDGFVGHQELLRIAEHLGMSPDQAEENVQGSYMVHDLNKDGKLSFEEYKVLYGQ